MWEARISYYYLAAVTHGIEKAVIIHMVKRRMTMKKKKVITLYRVSTKKQIERAGAANEASPKHDIPMQKQACESFINAKPDWEFYRELSEFGVSGYKVSARDRDAIQEIQQEALAGDLMYCWCLCLIDWEESTMKHLLLLSGS